MAEGYVLTSATTKETSHGILNPIKRLWASENRCFPNENHPLLESEREEKGNERNEAKRGRRRGERRCQKKVDIFFFHLFMFVFHVLLKFMDCCFSRNKFKSRREESKEEAHTFSKKKKEKKIGSIFSSCF